MKGILAKLALASMLPLAAAQAARTDFSRGRCRQAPPPAPAGRYDRCLRIGATLLHPSRRSA
ncbi:exported protein of unknown function [Burkholderia multivorans]